MELTWTALAVVVSLLSLGISVIHWSLSARERRDERETKLGYREADRLALEKREEAERLTLEKRELKEDLRQINKKLDDALARLSRLEGSK